MPMPMLSTLTSPSKPDKFLLTNVVAILEQLEMELYRMQPDSPKGQKAKEILIKQLEVVFNYSKYLSPALGQILSFVAADIKKVIAAVQREEPNFATLNTFADGLAHLGNELNNLAAQEKLK
jgi:hypothetical protein